MRGPEAAARGGLQSAAAGGARSLPSPGQQQQPKQRKFISTNHKRTREFQEQARSLHKSSIAVSLV